MGIILPSPFRNPEVRQYNSKLNSVLTFKKARDILGPIYFLTLILCPNAADFWNQHNIIQGVWVLYRFPQLSILSRNSIVIRLESP